MGDVERVQSPPAVYTRVVTEPWDFSGRGPRKGWVAFQARNKDGEPYWRKVLQPDCNRLLILVPADLLLINSLLVEWLTKQQLMELVPVLLL